MRVRDLMTARPITVSPDMPMLQARQRMVDERIRHLIVVEDDRVVGIVTDRDIRLNLPSPATSLSVWEINYLLARLSVESVMTKALVTVSPGWDPRDAAVLMLDHKIGALPVVDNGELVGIITETDLLRAFVKTA